VTNFDRLSPEEKKKAEERIRIIYVTWDELCTNHESANEFKTLAYLSAPIVTEIAYRYILDVKRIKIFHPTEIENINEYKIAGYLSYWICKLRPVQIVKHVTRFTKIQSLLNEELAFHISISRINLERSINNEPKIDFFKHDDEKRKKFINDLFYSMKYRLTTGDTLSQIYKYTEVF
jgi:hypothetical protein